MNKHESADEKVTFRLYIYSKKLGHIVRAKEKRTNVRNENFRGFLTF